MITCEGSFCPTFENMETIGRRATMMGNSSMAQLAAENRYVG